MTKFYPERAEVSIPAATAYENSPGDVKLRFILEKSSCPQITPMPADKTTAKIGWAIQLSGDAPRVRNSMKICANLRNLRIELRFLGLRTQRMRRRWRARRRIFQKDRA